MLPAKGGIVRYLSFALVIIILVLLPPRSRVVDPPRCIGICIEENAPAEQVIVPDTDGDL